jgi:oligoribonuclease NrnB/cAMP/cGMP phosphodiesterase (DHH superfamily)
MKIKLFTHTDLDGVGCAIVANNAFGVESVDVEYCDYNEINKKVKYFFAGVKHDDYDRIFITDISLDVETAKLINTHPLVKQGKLQLIDHHKTALYLAETYPWAEVRVEESNMFPEFDDRDKILASGTSLFYKFLRNKNIPKIRTNPRLKAFAENVRRYDCWEWNNHYNDTHPKRLNDLLYIIGREKFVDRFSNNPMTIFTDTEEILLEIEEQRINKYILQKKQDVVTEFVEIDDKKYHIAYVFAESNTSILGNEIAKDYNGYVDFVAIIDISRNKVSLRGIHSFPRLGLDIASHFGGGGHDNSAGFEFDVSLSHSLFKKVFKKEEE